jgi:hypothetical protein
MCSRRAIEMVLRALYAPLLYQSVEVIMGFLLFERFQDMRITRVVQGFILKMYLEPRLLSVFVSQIVWQSALS